MNSFWKPIWSNALHLAFTEVQIHRLKIIVFNLHELTKVALSFLAVKEIIFFRVIIIAAHSFHIQKYYENLQNGAP